MRHPAVSLPGCVAGEGQSAGWLEEGSTPLSAQPWPKTPTQVIQQHIHKPRPEALFVLRDRLRLSHPPQCPWSLSFPAGGVRFPLSYLTLHNIRAEMASQQYVSLEVSDPTPSPRATATIRDAQRARRNHHPSGKRQAARCKLIAHARTSCCLSGYSRGAVDAVAIAMDSDGG